MLVVDGLVYQFTANALELAPTSGGGSGLEGPNSITLTFEDSNNDPVPLVDFTIVGQGPGRSGVDGIAAFGLSDGTYTVAARAAGLLFANATLTVTGTTAQTITGTAVVITPPADPLYCTVAGNLNLPTTETQTARLIVFTLSETGPCTAGGVLVDKRQEVTTDADGSFSVELVRNDEITPAGTTWRVDCREAGLRGYEIELEAGTFDFNAELTADL